MIDSDAVQAAGAKLCESLRELGLYADADHDLHVQELPDGRQIVLIDALVGDVAFGKRVQDPEQHDFDREFRQMTRGSDGDRFLDVRNELQRRIEEGRPLFGDG